LLTRIHEIFFDFKECRGVRASEGSLRSNCDPQETLQSLEIRKFHARGDFSLVTFLWVAAKER
jgi:hypothetical protein